MKRYLILALFLVAACEMPTGTAPGATGVNPPGGITVLNGVRVNPVNADLFEVIPRAGARFDDYWCGASEYARRVQGASWTTEVYVASGIQPSVTTGRRSSVQFTINPGALGITPIDQTFRSGFKVGDSMSVQAAKTRCRPYNPFLDR
ncbi:hypothetical protein SAMN05444007_101421 [Cribrihabitans marinus]|uniref:Lipoprotein n=1 Tax=Cribrihabitans marinus TaxID=1227549 RepID=A0A1H6R6X9_9RHOB|nr:hypothetical protein [Cribrihabitans marinus]GGH20586.1 hypothetical protein GCM10010973_04630 [Cribrihabitans marinus]SEI51493.1 hypothetical protein SAMN05444007_101421 [Cribrihabitans marinus]